MQGKGARVRQDDRVMSKRDVIGTRALLSGLLALACQQLAAGAGDPERVASSPPRVVLASLPSDAQLEYRTTAVFHLAGVPLTVHATTTTLWHLDKDRYEAHLHMDTAGFDQLSQGTTQGDGALAPMKYTETRPFHESESVRIDWPRARLQFGARPWVPAPDAGAQDRLSLQFELARERLASPDAFAVGSAHAVRLIGTHDVDPWTFTVSADETVETGQGPMRSVRVAARRPLGSVTETMDLWLGESLHWLPVRIRIVDRNGAVIDSVLQSAQLS
jgi:hypothetical protein